LAINKKLEVLFHPDEGKELPPERETFYDNPTCSNGYSPHVKVEMMPTTRYPDPKYPVIEQDLRKEHRRHHIVYREASEGPFQFVKATGLNLEFKGLDQFAFRKGGGFKVSGYPLRLTMECD
jgi:hypothetical protein